MMELKNHKWRNWKNTNDEIEKPQMKKLKNHKWRNGKTTNVKLKTTNEEIEKTQMKKFKNINEELKNHK